MASAGTVSIDFAAETARFTAELKKVQGSLKGLESNFNSIERVAGKALQFFSGVALTAFAKSAFTAADATATAAERAGIAVESFSRLQFAAGQVDVEMSALTTGIQRFQIGLANADSGQKEAMRSLANFNLQAKDLAGLQIEDQLAKAAEGFARITDPAERTRAAVELFGRSAGPQLVPFLAQGAAGIRALTAEADRLGITMSTGTAEGINAADEALKRLRATTMGWTANFLGTAALGVERMMTAINGPSAEVQKLQVDLNRLLDERNQKLETLRRLEATPPTGLFDDVRAESVRILKYELEGLAPRIDTVNAKLQAIGQSDVAVFQAQAAMAKANADMSALIQEIDLAPIQAMKIAVDELDVAYRQLAISAAAARDAKLQAVAELDPAVLEQQATAAIAIELESRAALEQVAFEERIAREQAAAQIITTLHQQTYGNAISALQAFAGRSEKVAKALVLIQRGKALAEAFMLGKVAIQQAAASAPPPYNIPAIVSATALAAANVAAIAATAYGQIKSISSSGATLGSVANPVFTDDSDQEEFGAESRAVTQIIVNGNIFSSRETADWFIEEVTSRISDEDVIIISPNSRQAQELLPA